MIMMKKTKLFRGFALLLVVVMLLCACQDRVLPDTASSNNGPQTVSGNGESDPSQQEYSSPDLALSVAAEPLTVNGGSLEDIVVDTATGALAELDLSIPQTFAITRPDEKLTTDLASYFIMGTSDPSKPVYYGSTEIERMGSKGVFGVHVSLAMGANSFTFSQGDKTETVSITRTAKAGVSPISHIVQSSMYPAYQGGVKVGEGLLLQCVAPSGASVSATFGGKTVALQQVAQANAGIPATFRGTMTIEDSDEYQDDETTKIGSITYAMTYNGTTKSYESSGDVYVAGKDSRIAIQVTSYMGFLYSDTSNLAVFREKLRTGSTDYVQSQDNEYYHLSSGGYLPVEQAGIIQGKVNINNKLSAVQFSAQSKSESYTFSGTSAPAFFTKLGDGTFAITFFNSSGTPSLDTSSSKLFSSVSATDNGGSVSYIFNIKNGGGLWGYHVSHQGNDTVVRFAYKPTVSSGSLSGVTVVLDPGHGGYEVGALGLAGTTGPDEATINLAHALAAKESLEAMGAKVLLTRTDDTFISLDDRLKFFDESGADFFLSIHHNSVAESSNGNTVSGMEMYYHTSHSYSFASKIMSNAASNMGRNNRGTMQSYYRVTLSPYAPSMLFEMGFMCNPVEYERATDVASIQKAGQAIANSVKAALS